MRTSLDEAGSPVDCPKHADERRGHHDEEYPVDDQYDNAGSYSLASGGSAVEEHFVCGAPSVFRERQSTWDLSTTTGLLTNNGMSDHPANISNDAD